MAQITLLRKSTTFDTALSAHRMKLEVTAAEGITRAIFVKQRLKNALKNSFDDVTVAVATPTQIEDLDEFSPAAGDSYFRSTTADFISSSTEYLEDVFTSITNDLQRLVSDLESLNNMEADGLYVITADYIEENMAINHTHYRLPLAARPSGNNEVWLDGEIDRHRVASQDTALSGWLNADGNTPTGYHFRYNLAKDSALSALWPIPTEKINYAHLEVNGASNGDVLINANGIFWKGNLYGQAPWPADYVNPGDTGNAANKVVLVLDFIN